MRFPECAVLLVLTLGGCGGALAEGESQFKKGRYPEAKQTFASLEEEAARYDDAKRAEYALYRGLTLGALGDRVQSGVWLREAKTLEAAHPGSLSSEDARRMKAAIDASDVP
jgi:TolA-binding protein